MSKGCHEMSIECYLNKLPNKSTLAVGMLLTAKIRRIFKSTDQVTILSAITMLGRVGTYSMVGKKKSIIWFHTCTSLRNITFFIWLFVAFWLHLLTARNTKYREINFSITSFYARQAKKVMEILKNKIWSYDEIYLSLPLTHGTFGF